MLFLKMGFYFSYDSNIKSKHKLHCLVLYRADGAFECRTTSWMLSASSYKQKHLRNM